MAAQLRLQDSKEKFQTAYDYAVSQKEEAEKNYKFEKDEGLTQHSFEAWAVMNAPAYSATIQQYQAARAVYEASLHAVDEQAARSWQEKVRQAVIDNKLNYNILIGPDE
ncbi:hypothetical protein FGSG_09072 [Fusarium graminearum PH-1]|uniref:Chromosome 4, complete genome n=1 Tax=Gibberella zeae (strain ATCC MYA-4620 / CBS 123657 / FGSC 9075 / NRRL 31084 / PH-1) TaxID=229533 RepID=I1RXK1_GIBZE|nr:hypothetical protein FGSG_09072 [Fusarium graminearum PH-1]ESU15595.1 hypothetical protein FGSG_09072 [Fusarium graminearum PH-1]EYB22065.1 hypothetical protein FG05_09072 [Fusarium graminearum]CAF3622250.1 unnamed protein product [Fusarium graminearum]CEF85269.1 unnamed protein product [Fusarium graminearum]|eukprot:XP_011328721.1 hypothetical protein FGSG_09072 [Fusarium graminearum PH-1]